MVSTRSTVRRLQEDSTQDATPSEATPTSQSSVGRASTRTRRGRPESSTPTKVTRPPEDNSPKSAGPSRTPVMRKKKGPYTPLPPSSHRKNQSISTAFNGLGIEETPPKPEPSSSSSSSSRRSLGKRPAISPAQDGTSVSSSPISGETSPRSANTYSKDAADAIITPRRKGRPYKVDLNEVAPRTPPQPARPTKVLGYTPPKELVSNPSTSTRKVIRSDDDLMTPEAIAKRSMEREERLLHAVSQRARQAGYTASIYEDSDGDEGSDDELPQIELPMDLGDLIRDETPEPASQRGPAVTLGPEGTHIILDHFALSCEGTWQGKKTREYPKEWVDEHLHGLLRRGTDIIDP